MDRIVLSNVVPQVFADKDMAYSDIWNKEVSFHKGKKYLIEAASGTGKSSLGSFIYGYRKDYNGTICFDSQDISGMGIQQWIDIRKNHLGMLFQELRLFTELTAMENIELKNNLTHTRTRAEIDSWMNRLGIADKANQMVGRMSFGQQQRVAFIRALCQPVDFLFMDEPVSHLDKNNGMLMSDILDEEIHNTGMGVIITSIGHHVDMDYSMNLKL